MKLTNIGGATAILEQNGKGYCLTLGWMKAYYMGHGIIGQN